MSIYDEKYDIRQARASDIDDIMSYIRTNWKSEHILGNNRSFFEYEHVNKYGVNFIIARERDGNKLKGIIGYLYASLSSTKSDVWPVMWMVDNDTIPLLGLKLFDKVRELPNARNVIGVGEQKKTTVPMLKTYYKFFVGKLNHFYMLSDRDEFKIARISYIPKCADLADDSTSIVLCNRDDLGRLFDFSLFQDCIPYKDADFFAHRYFDNPIYRYNTYVLSNEQNKAIMVTRKQEMNGSVALRIIDYYGDPGLLSGLNSFWKKQLEVYEYIDFYNLGIDEEILLNSGFTLIADDDENIIPDRFYPYVPKNIEVYCTSPVENAVFCKGDADQDRPVVG